MGCAYLYGLLAFDSKWVPPVGGVPSRHIGTGGGADGVHDQCLRDSGAGESSGAPTQAARQAADEAMSSSRGDARAAKRARTGDRRGEDSPLTRLTDLKGVTFEFRGSEF
jgi:hypothetical protein